MLSRIQLESRVQDIYDLVKKGKKNEDSFVEMKSTWPSDPSKAARRIAGHANFARGEAILWLIGLDETEGVKEFESEELADWWQKVKTEFESVAPELKEYVVHTDDGPIMTLCFDTSSGPFVVKNPAHGKRGGGPVSLEIPWRDGTKVRTATRANLIRLIAPLQPLPSIEILSASVGVCECDAINDSHNEGFPPITKKPHLEWNIHIEMYVAPQVGTTVILPLHRTRLCLTDNHQSEIVGTRYRESYSLPYRFVGSMSRLDSVSAEVTSSEAVFHLPGRLEYNLTIYEAQKSIPNDFDVALSYSVKPVYTEHTMKIDIPLQMRKSEQSKSRSWKYLND